MKNTLKRSLAIALCVVMLFGSAPLSGFAGIELPEWMKFGQVTAHAATIAENDIFFTFPDYLDNTDCSEFEAKYISAICNTLRCNKTDSVIATALTTLEDGLTIGIKDLGHKLGWTDDYETSCLKEASFELLKSVSDVDVALNKTVEKVEDIFSPLKKAHKNASSSSVALKKQEFIDKWIGAYQSTTGISEAKANKILGADWD